MKKILITGENSYIGRSFINYSKEKNKNFIIDELSLRGNDWINYDFSNYDSILHVAGIAHIKETKKNSHLYYKINRDLAIEVAEKAKKEKVKHFVFFSTMSVYGLLEGNINKNTPTNPNSAYGKSKLQAENAIIKMSNNDFVVSILRPPMIYGPNSKGNYSSLSKFAKITKIFPNIDNQRSMLFVDNLSELLNKIIAEVSPGFFYPQNREYVNTSKMINEIAQLNNNRIIFTTLFNPIIKTLNLNIFNKVFGNLTYKDDMSTLDFEYQIYGLEESIYKTEKNKFENE